MATITVDHRTSSGKQAQTTSPEPKARPAVNPQPTRPAITVNGVVIPPCALPLPLPTFVTNLAASTPRHRDIRDECRDS